MGRLKMLDRITGPVLAGWVPCCHLLGQVLQSGAQQQAHLELRGFPQTGQLACSHAHRCQPRCLAGCMHTWGLLPCHCANCVIFHDGRQDSLPLLHGAEGVVVVEGPELHCHNTTSGAGSLWSKLPPPVGRIGQVRWALGGSLNNNKADYIILIKLDAI